MTEDNDLLLQQFFRDAAQQQIADDGFTERVMQQLPQTRCNLQRFNRVWTLFCVGVFLVLFVWFRGWELLAIHFEVLLRTLSVETFSINLPLLAAILFSLLLVGVGEVAYNER